MIVPALGLSTITPVKEMRKVTEPSDVGLTKVFERVCLFRRIRLILVGLYL